MIAAAFLRWFGIEIVDSHEIRCQIHRLRTSSEALARAVRLAISSPQPTDRQEMNHGDSR